MYRKYPEPITTQYVKCSEKWTPISTWAGELNSTWKATNRIRAASYRS